MEVEESKTGPENGGTEQCDYLGSRENKRKTPQDVGSPVADAAKKKGRDDESGHIFTSGEDQDPPRRLISHACLPA